jgi:hypothetical protein
MIRFFYNLAPNPMKVALCLEEAGLPYEAIPVDTRKGEQHLPAYTAINPNAKLPAIVDGDATVFDSNAILLYLAEKTGQFLPANTPAGRGEMLSWLMFVASGIGPYSGQCVHFRHFAPEPKNMRSTATTSRPGGTGRSWSSTWPRAPGCWATPTPSSTWPCGAGRAWCPSCRATPRPGRSCRTSSAGSTPCSNARRRNALRR